MGNNTRSNRREAEQKSQRYYKDNLRWLIALTHNTVEFENAGETPKRYLLKVLINEGAIAYDKVTNLYLRFVPIGIDAYGLPLEYQLYGYNGITYRRKANEVVILRINDIQYPLKPYLEIQAKKITQFDLAIEQNLEAIKTMTIAETDSDSNILSLVNEAEARRVGTTVIYRNKNTSLGSHLTVSSTGAQYLIDKLQEAKQKEINAVLTRIGVANANTDKRERVQSIEVNASLGYAIDSVGVEFETFNYDAEQGGLDIRMKPKTSAFKIWSERENEREKNENDNNKDKNNSNEIT